MFTDLLLARGTAQYYALEHLLQLRQTRPQPPRPTKSPARRRRFAWLLRRPLERPVLQGCG